MKKILVIRVGRVGDMVMITPAMRALIEHYPDAEFTLLTSSDGKRIFDGFHSQIKHIRIYDRKSVLAFIVRRSIKKAITDTGFDHIYNFESKKSYSRLLNGSLAVIHSMSNNQNVMHAAKRRLELVNEGLGKDVGFYPLNLPVEEKSVRFNHSMLTDIGVSDNTFIVAFHPTFSGVGSKRKSKKVGLHKLWPRASFARLADMLSVYAKQQNMDMRFLLNLMPDEMEIGEDIARQCKTAKIDLLCPQPNMKNYLAFLKRVDLLIVPDTGPMHLAAAVGAPLVALFSRKDPADCGPYADADKFTVLRAELCASPEKGLAAIDVEDVYAACLTQMKKGSRA